jgi:hypothetical protein
MSGSSEEVELRDLSADDPEVTFHWYTLAKRGPEDGIASEAAGEGQGSWSLPSPLRAPT